MSSVGSPSRQERRAFSRLLKKKRTIALTPANLVLAVEGLEEGKWWDTLDRRGLGGRLGVPISKQLEINQQHSSPSERLSSLFRYFLQLHPDASWRAVVRALDQMEETVIADRLRQQCQPLTDSSLTLEAVIAVLESVSNWDMGGESLGIWLGVPASVQTVIETTHGDDRERKRAVADYVLYFLNTVPGASWTTLAGVLYFWEEEKALQAVRKYLKKEEEPSLTVHNILSVCEGVTGWTGGGGLGEGLRVPQPRLGDIGGRYQSMSERKEAVLNEWLKNHPAPSWKGLAKALYVMGEHSALQRIYGKYIAAPPIARRLSALHQVMEEKGYVDQRVMQAVLLGFPRSGKSSLKNRLTGKPAQILTSSTGVADKAVRVEISSSTVQLSELDWTALEGLDEEALLLSDDILQEQPKEIGEDEGSTSEESEDDQPNISSAGDDIAAKKSSKFSLVSFIQKIKQRFAKSSSNVSNKEPPKHDGSNSLLDPTSVFEAAFTNQVQSKRKQSSASPWTLYLTDTGGQPEFQGLVRSMVIGPSLFIIVFRLDRNLNTQFVVEYQHPDGGFMTPYETSFTTKEALLQFLATISSVGSFTKVEDGKEVRVKPKALFVGTHRDKLLSEEQFLEIDRELQELIKSTEAYRDGLIEFASEDQLVLPINNMSDEEGDVQKIRAVVERIGRRGNDYQVQTPYPTLIFSIVVRYLKKPILTYDEGFQIAKKCGIETHEEFSDALWFLHNRVGVIRYFQDIPELHNVIINSPQYIFDKVTELIVSTFTFENTPPNVYEQFLKKGIFPLDTFERLADMDVLTPQQLICLLEHLHIIAPLLEGGAVTKYFAPCVLAHAEDTSPCATNTETALPPLLLTFESGYCPTGLFAVLVVHLLSSSRKASLDWILEQDKIYRNSITLSIGPYDAFKLSVFPSHMRVQLAWSAPTSDRRLPLGRVCCDVRGCVQNAISQVVELLHYTEKAQYSLGFPCPGEEHFHCALINYVDGEPVNLTCSLAKKRFDLPSGHAAWFNENEQLAITSGLPAETARNESACVVTSGHVDQLAALLHPVAGNWSLFLGQLGVQPSDREQTAANNAGKPSFAMLCLVDGLNLWVRSHDNPTYKRITEVLRGRMLPNITLASDVEAFAKQY